MKDITKHRDHMDSRIIDDWLEQTNDTIKCIKDRFRTRESFLEECKKYINVTDDNKFLERYYKK